MGVLTRSAAGSIRARTTVGIVVVWAAILATSAGLPAGEAPPRTPEPNEVDKLATGQGQLSEKYIRLETLMLRAAEFDAGSNPRRSALLRQALAQSKDRHVRLQLETLVELLNQNKLSPALENQNQVVQDLKSLLDLLLTENRPDRLKSEQQRVRGYIKELERIIRQQRGVQGRTEGGDDKNRLATDEGRIADRTGQLGKTIDENEKSDQADPDGADEGQPADPPENAPGDNPETPSDDEKNADSDRDGQPQNGDGQDRPQQEGDSGSESQKNNGDGQNNPQQNGESEPPSADQPPSSPGDQEEQPPQSEPNQGETPPSPSTPPIPGQGQPSPSPGQGQSPSPGQGQSPSPGQGQPQPSTPNESENQDEPQNEQQPPGQPPSSPPDQFPGRQRIAEAEQKMRLAQERLDEAKRQEAIDQQEEARQLLEQAKAELEKILRQLREEEIERMLALLESRFRKMLEMQLKVYESTKTLDEIPAARRDRQVDIRAGKLSLDERRIVIEADKALALLREEGSSVAFPETVGQMREDMQQVVDRLARTKIAAITQGIEEDIIAALEEAIQALQQAQEEQSQRQNQQAPPPGQSEDPPLVDALAELRLVKALQVRVNKRTNRYARLLADMDDPAGQASDDELIEALEALSDREERIYRITRDIVEGRNK